MVKLTNTNFTLRPQIGEKWETAECEEATCEGPGQIVKEDVGKVRNRRGHCVGDMSMGMGMSSSSSSMSPMGLLPNASSSYLYERILKL